MLIEIRKGNVFRMYAIWKVKENHIKIIRSLESQGYPRRVRELETPIDFLPCMSTFSIKCPDLHDGVLSNGTY